MILTRKHDINGALIGMLLGDSCIANPNRNPYLTTEHCFKQLPYLEWKHSLLRGFLGGEIRPTKRNSFYWQTEHTPKLQFLYQDFYKFPYVGALKREKKVSIRLLNRLTDLGLALWIADDGTLCRRDRSISLATFNFKREGNEIMQLWFEKKFGIEARLLFNRVKLTTAGCEWFLRFPVEDTKKLLDVVGPWLRQIPSVEYKAEIRPYIRTMRSKKVLLKT